MTMMATIGALLLSWAAAQDPDPQAEEKAAQEVLKAHREKRAQAKTEDELIAAISILSAAKPHPLIRTELIGLLDHPYPPAVRIPVADALGAWKGDAAACSALMRRIREETSKESRELRKSCLRAFGAIAPFGKSIELSPVLSDPSIAVAREAVKAASAIRSVRILQALISFLGELERIREDGAPRKELMQPTREAITEIWQKVKPRLKLRDYTEANRLWVLHRDDIRRILAEEERADREAKRP